MTNTLWKNRDFILVIIGRTISQFGTAMTTFVIPWLLLQLTGSGTQTGIAFAIGFVPYILVSLPAGVWADRRDRKKLMIASDFGRLVLLLSIPLVHLTTDLTPLSMLYIVQAGVSGLSAIFDASYGACVPNVVGKEQLREANNILQMSTSLSRIIGPILGGMAVAWIGATSTIVFDVCSYAISIVTVLAITTSFSSTSSSATKNTFLHDVREGITVVWSITPIRHLMLFATLVNLVGPGMDVALLFRIQHELKLPSAWAGIIMTGLSGGMLFGSFVNRWAGKRINMIKWLTISAVLQVLPPVFLTFTTNPVALCIIQVFIGILIVAWNVQSVTLRQTLIPDHLLGRSSSVFRLAAWVSIPLGDAAAGIMSQRFGTSLYFVWAAIVLFMVAILTVGVRLQDPVHTSASLD